MESQVKTGLSEHRQPETSEVVQEDVVARFAATGKAGMVKNEKDTDTESNLKGRKTLPPEKGSLVHLYRLHDMYDGSVHGCLCR